MKKIVLKISLLCVFISFAQSNAAVIGCGYAHNVVLLPTTGVSAWGENGNKQTIVPANISGVKAVAAGGYHTLVLKNDGTIAIWGWAEDGVLDVPVGLIAKAIAGGGYHSIALKADGTVVGWGDPSDGSTVAPANLKAMDIAAGYHYSAAIKTDSTVVAWGAKSESKGQLSVPAGLKSVVAIATGRFHMLALKSDGSVVAWGMNDLKQSTVPAGLKAKAIAAGENHSVAVKTDGTVVCWGSNDNGQTTVPVGLSNVIAVSAGRYHSLALKASGELVAWGSNAAGQGKIPAGVTGNTGGTGLINSFFISNQKSYINALKVNVGLFDCAGRFYKNGKQNAFANSNVINATFLLYTHNNVR